MIQRIFKNVSTVLFSIMERIVIKSSHPKAMKTFFRPPCSKSEHKVSFFIFGVEGHIKVFCILSSSLIISVRTFDISERKTVFEIAKVLKTIILPSSVTRHICQTFRTFWNLVMLSRKIFSFRFSLLYEKLIRVIFMVSLYKLMHFRPQTAIFTSFSTPIPAISYFSWFGFNPEYFENVANVLRSSLIDLLSLKKKVICLRRLNKNKCA